MVEFVRGNQKVRKERECERGGMGEKGECVRDKRVSER